MKGVISIITQVRFSNGRTNPLKSSYEKPILMIEFFDEKDLITESPSNFDGVGYIPDDWLEGGWNA